MKKYFYFGEEMTGYDIRVLNEREVRAAAGILFFFAMITFLTAFLTGNFYPTKIFVVIFLTDFVIRIFINPKYSPSMILGRIMVSAQKPEYVGAPQKRFAWVIGFMLATFMLFSIVIHNTVGPLNMITCTLCIILLFFESAFGICLGCKIYNLFSKDKAKLCPGGTCEITKKEEIQKVSTLQILILIISFALIILLLDSSFSKQINTENNHMNHMNEMNGMNSNETESSSSCLVPNWVKAVGHEEEYKSHICK